eukprot:6195005-Pleurochrysis_carterae.AAC.2
MQPSCFLRVSTIRRAPSIWSRPPLPSSRDDVHVRVGHSIAIVSCSGCMTAVRDGPSEGVRTLSKHISMNASYAHAVFQTRLRAILTICSSREFRQSWVQEAARRGPRPRGRVQRGARREEIAQKLFA